METSLPTPMTAKFYVNLPEGMIYIYHRISKCVPTERHLSFTHQETNAQTDEAQGDLEKMCPLHLGIPSTSPGR